MKEDLSQLAVDGQIGKNVLVHAVVVVIIVGFDLVGPNGFAGFRSSGKYGARPFVVSSTLVRISRAGIRCSVVDQVKIGVV